MTAKRHPIKTRFNYALKRPFLRKGRSILKRDTNAHSLSMGISVGFFIALTPLFGIHMILAILLCRLLRANSIVALTVTWITNPLTAAPIYFFNYWVGTLFFSKEKILRLEDIEALFTHFSWSRFIAQGEQFYFPLIVGSTIVGAIGGAILYFFSRYLFSQIILPLWKKQKG